MTLKQLSKKYPKAWKQYYLSNYCNRYFDDDDVRDCWRGITDFMDKQGIYMAYYIDEYAPPLFVPFIYDKHSSSSIDNECINKRKDVETKLIDRAFEILEERTNK